MGGDRGSVFVVYDAIFRLDAGVGLRKSAVNDDAVNDADRQAGLVTCYDLSRFSVAAIEQLLGRRQLYSDVAGLLIDPVPPTLKDEPSSRGQWRVPAEEKPSEVEEEPPKE